MAIYQIKYTSGVDTITVQPGSVNGSAGFPTTDLELYGQGALNWGQGVDQNQLRILECWACPQASGATLRPVNKDDTGVANYSGDGVGTGINKPIKGQLWFNTTDEKLYICNDPTGTPDWGTAGADPDLFLPLTGGTMTGPIDMTNAAPRFAMTVTGAGGEKGRLAVTHNPTAADNTVRSVYATELVNPGDPMDLSTQPAAYSSNTDHIVISKENGSSGWIGQLRLQDDGIVYRTGSGGNLGKGTIRVSQPISASHHETTLTTKKWVDDLFTAEDAVRQNVTSAQTVIGTFQIENSNPRLYLKNTGSTTDVNVEFYGSDDTNPKGILYLDQTAGGTTGADYMTLLLRDGGVTKGRITIQPDKIHIQGEGTESTSIWTTNLGSGDGAARAGKIYTPGTINTDSNNVLTTKSYVDGLVAGNTVPAGTYVSLPSQTSGMTGEYRFGVNANDTKIDNGSFISTVGSGQRTEISGDDFLSRSSSANMLEISSAALTSTYTNGTTNIQGSEIKSLPLVAPFSSNTTIDKNVLTVANSTGVDTVITGPQIVSTRASGTATGTTTIDGRTITVANGSNTLTIDGIQLQTNQTSGSLQGATTIQGNAITATSSGSGFETGSTAIQGSKILITPGSGSSTMTITGTQFQSDDGSGGSTTINGPNVTINDSGRGFEFSDGAVTQTRIGTLNNLYLSGASGIVDHSYGAGTVKFTMHNNATPAGSNRQSMIQLTSGNVELLTYTGGGSPDSSFQLSRTVADIDVPLRMAKAAGGGVANNQARAARFFNQALAPAASLANDGDFWVEPNANSGNPVLWLKMPGSWVRLRDNYNHPD